MNLLLTPVMHILEKKLDVCTLRQRVIANNVANVDTPGFKASHVELENTLRQALNHQDTLSLRKTDPRHIEPYLSTKAVHATMTIDKTTSLRNDGNNVDIDREMTDLAKNEIDYQTVAQLLSHKYSGEIKLITELGKV